MRFRRGNRRKVDPASTRSVERLFVPRVGVPHHARSGVGGQHPLEPLGGSGGAVGHDDHPGVNGVADTDSAAVMDAHPGRSRGHVQERVQDRPVGDRVGAVPHRLGLPVRGCDRSRVEVIAADHHRGAYAARVHELVDRQPCTSAVAVAEPADPRRKTLERNPSGRELEPATKKHVVRERAPRAPRRSPRCQQRPPRALPTGTDRLRDRRAAGYRPGRSPGMRRRPLRRLHGPPLAGCCHSRKRSTLLGRARAAPRREPRSTIAHASDTRRGRSHEARQPRRRRGLRGCTRAADHGRPSGRSRDRSSHPAARAPARAPRRSRAARSTARGGLRRPHAERGRRRRANPSPGAGNASRDGVRSATDRPRCTGSPHPPWSRREVVLHPFPPVRPSGSSARRDRCFRSASRRRPRTSGTSPAGSPACRCRSSSRRSSARTWSSPRLPNAETRPTSPTAGRSASWRSGHAAPTPRFGTRQQASRSGRAASRRRRAEGGSSRSPSARRGFAQPSRCRRRPRASRDARLPRGRGC